MKQGKSLVDLAKELERQSTEKTDYISDTRNIQLSRENNNLILQGNNDHFNITNNAHQQISNWLNIPAKYYNRMKLDSPALLADNVNHWLQNKVFEKQRMIRTLDGKCRAFLSNRYHRIDNEHVANAALPILLENDSIKVVSADITEKRLFIKALYPRIEGEVKQGDLVQAGVVISNSEVGQGALRVQPLIYRLVCTNGMISNVSNEYGFNKYHIGKKITADETNYQIYSNATMQADDRAILLKLQDTIRAASNPEIFKNLLVRMRQAAESSTITAPVKAVETLGKTFGLGQLEQNSILENLIRDGDYSKWGALNAVTETANHLSDYQRSTELEEIGGLILDLPNKDWMDISTAA